MLRSAVAEAARPLHRVAAAVAYSTTAAAATPNSSKSGVSSSKFPAYSGRNVVLVDGVRTPFVTSGTDYIDLLSYDLGRMAIAGLVDKTKIDPSLVDSLMMGSVVLDPSIPNVARESALAAGIPSTTPCHTITLACISSNVAAMHGTNMIANGDADIVIAGGTDTLSDMALRLSRPVRKVLIHSKKYKGTQGKLNAARTVLRNPFGIEAMAVAEYSTGEVMGHSADRLASAFGVSRQAQDEYAQRSHTRAMEAQKAGLLSDVISVMVPGQGKITSQDNGIRVTPMEKLAKLKPSFIKEFGSVTPGNSSFFTDGATAALLMAEDKARAMGFKPKSYLRQTVLVGRSPQDELLLGPAYAIAKLLRKTNMTLDDFDVIEMHEAFAGQLLANFAALDSDSFCRQHMGMPGKVGAPELSRVNAWGGSLSLGHPFGATGVRLLTTASNRLLHEDKQLALVTACAAGGHGVATIVERCP